MNFLRIIIFAVVALLQLSVPASVIWKREQTLRHGRIWKFKTEPVDPVDAVRGRYLSLRFAAERSPRENWPSAQPSCEQSAAERETMVFVSLKEDAEGFAAVDDIGYCPRSGDNIVRAENLGFVEGVVRLRFPFDRFWIAEANAPAAERAYIENSRREKQNAYVTIRVHNGDAALEQLYIDNQLLRDYLLNHSAR